MPQVKAHSIVAVRGGPPYEGGSDGVVEFESASIDGVQSELVIDSDHSVQNHPLLSQEVRRILLQHIGLEREIMERIELRGARGLRGAPH